MSSDIILVLSWWAVLFLIGVAAFPITRRIFGRFWDQGYSLSKAVGLAVTTYGVWQLGSWHILPFATSTIIAVLVVVFLVGIGIELKWGRKEEKAFPIVKIILLEILFLAMLTTWSWVKAHEPDIHGLEKFMDYGFSQTILHTDYFPPADMWYAGGTINYYYFGHTAQALLSKFSGIDLAYGYNLMLSTLFAFCFTMSFSLGVEVFRRISLSGKEKISRRVVWWSFVAGLFVAFLVSLSGNMQTVYAFTQGYSGDNPPPPFWTVMWKPSEFIAKLPEGTNKYWYANATRFIPFTIHEFPGYSFVVSDNHGHVLSIPFVLLTIASLLTFFVISRHPSDTELSNHVSKTKRGKELLLSIKEYIPYVVYGWLIAILFMTNALDGPIYLGLFTFLAAFSPSKHPFASFEWMKQLGSKLGIVILSFVLFALPFLLTFTSFANGIAINCPPSFLANTKVGPILFESVEKCQHSPLWMILVLWGFFFYNGIFFIVDGLLARKKNKQTEQSFSLYRFFGIVFFYCVGLILFAEFFYFKDIYPAHFRSNTMFKLGYQAFILCSLLSGVMIVRVLSSKWNRNIHLPKIVRWGYLTVLLPQLFLVSIFPYFSVRSYFGGLNEYKGLNGLTWFERQYPDDFKATQWINAKVATEKRITPKSQYGYLVKNNFFTSHVASVPVVLEADGDSYTDYARISAFGGVPTVIGWGVHEWLWRGTYDIVAPRRDDVSKIYQSTDTAQAKMLLKKYNVSYVVVGTLERQKYEQLNLEPFVTFGHIVFSSGDTEVYALDKI
jgi:YYY domain-containing protein